LTGKPNLSPRFKKKHLKIAYKTKNTLEKLLRPKKSAFLTYCAVEA